MKKFEISSFLLLFLLIPLIISIIYFTNSGTSFTLHRNDIEPISYFLSNYSHDFEFHFIGNLVMYLFLAVPFYLVENKKKLFYNSLIIFLIVPLVVSLSVFFNSSGSVLGFSGIVCAFAGYLLFDLIFKLRKEIKYLYIVSIIFPLALIIYLPFDSMFNFYGHLFGCISGVLVYFSGKFLRKCSVLYRNSFHK